MFSAYLVVLLLCFRTVEVQIIVGLSAMHLWQTKLEVEFRTYLFSPVYLFLYINWVQCLLLMPVVVVVAT